MINKQPRITEEIKGKIKNYPEAKWTHSDPMSIGPWENCSKRKKIFTNITSYPGKK